ncbi:ovostatin-like [Hyperolius riggenbachi]|uniref:ovostatin-like n=1 Tax=Hyperolius riggenbachi TaxID=752182 RepID=UPI0035A364AA
MYLGGRTLLCALLILGCLGGGRTEPRYVLTSPASLQSGDTGRACLTIRDIDENLDVRMLLEHDGINTTIIEEDVVPPLYSQCGDYQIPKVSSAVPVFIFFSAIGKNTAIRERKTAVIEPTRNNCMFQMDKPMYKPGQKVRCRIICLNSQLKAVNEKFPAIYLQDPSRTKIAQWLNQETERGVTSLEFQLVSDAPAGSYFFQVERESQDYAMSQWFSVEQYVPPRFSISVDIPNTLSVLAESLNYNVTGIYTFGEPLAGTVVVRYCKQPSFYGRRQNCFKEKGETCFNVTGTLDSTGSFSGSIDLIDFHIPSTGTSINVQFTTIEAGTGIQVTESHYVWITSQPARLNFDYGAMNQYYKRNIPYTVVAKLTDEQNKPMPNEAIDIDVDGKPTQQATTDSNGQIEYKIDTTDMVVPNFTIKISYKNPEQCYYAEWRDTDYPTVDYMVFRFYSRSGSFLQAKHISGDLSCEQEQKVDVDIFMNTEAAVKDANKVTVYYLVMGRSNIVHSGHKDVDLGGSKNGTFTIAFPVSAEMSINSKLVIYCLLEEELVTDVVSFRTEACFKNKVDMTFSAEKGTPGSNVEVLLSADAGSMCGLRMIDYSLELLNPYESFSADGVLNSMGFSYYRYHGSGVGGFNLDDPETQCVDPNKEVFCNGNYYLPVSSDTEGDSYTDLRGVGMIVGSNSQMRKPEVCGKKENILHPSFPMPLANGGIGGKLTGVVYAESNDGSIRRSGAFSGGPAPVETIRSNFSDTFMWLMVPTDEQGHATVTGKTPDSVTKWKGSAFCISDKGGFGMTKQPASYTAFQPFFIDLNKPYSIIRGEKMLLTGIVYNYMEQCIKVQAKLESSDAFTAELKEGKQDACICSNGRATFAWEIQAKVLGEMTFTVSAETSFIGQSCDGANDPSQPPRKDTVVDTAFILPEGVPQEVTSSKLFFVGKDNAQFPLSITLPQSVVSDSTKAHVTAVGDILAVPLRSLNNLVRKPYGCAEQNMARMAAIPHVLDYLNNTDQMTPEILEKGKNYMAEGYYRQLGFTDGPAYKLFPNYREQANSWLTIKTFATFEAIKRYGVFVDEIRQQQSLIWLGNTQNLETGCFQPQGNSFLQEDAGNDIELTAYVAIALLETDYSLGKTLLEGAMQCLKNATTTDQTLLVEALMLRVFTLADMSEFSDPLLMKLMRKAIRNTDGTIHWQRKDMPEIRPVPFFTPVYRSPEVQITSYVLMSLAGSTCCRSELNMTTMAQITQWLVRQQNSHGGFSSTPDTVAAIQALSEVARIFYIPNPQQTVLVTKDNAEVANFNLNKENRLIAQRQALPDANGNYNIQVSGSGFCLVQTTVGYNIPIPKEDSAFTLALSASSDNCINEVAYSINLTVSLSYQGNKNSSGMALTTIRLMSGYNADYWSLKELENQGVVSKAEENSKGEVEIYHDSVTQKPITFQFRMFMGQRVLNVKTSSAMVYSYYTPDENGYASYDHPCADVKKPEN